MHGEGLLTRGMGLLPSMPDYTGDAAVQAMFGHASAGPGFFPLEDIQARIHRHDLPRLWGGLQAAIAVQEPLDIDFRVVWPDASVHYLSLAGRVVTNDQT